MGYNPYRWHISGKKKEGLKASAPLLLKIRNGDFNLSYYFGEAEKMRKAYQKQYDTEYKNQTTDETNVKELHAHHKARMKNVAYLKLMEDAAVDEERILRKLRKELEREFGADYWDEATSVEAGLRTIEDVYWKYKELSGMGSTPSEIAIQLGRKTAKQFQ